MTTVILIGLGALIAFVGGIMVLVAAFRQSIGWGLASLFLPFANLIFVVMHWAEAKAGFLVSLAGTAVIGLALATSPALRNAAAQLQALDSAKLQAAGLQMEKPAPAPDLNAQIQTLRDRIEQKEAAFASDGEAVLQLFKKLTEQRKALKQGDAAAVTAFNEQAADYQARNAARQQARQELDASRAELEALLGQRARQKAPAAAASGRKVVMYSTATCPACTMAKAYLAKKGVAYEERDVNTSPAARAEFQKLGGRGVPLILVGNERMEGFSAQRLDQLL